MPSESVTSLRGVGKVFQQRLERLNIRTKLDLILHLPYRFQDRTSVTALSDVVSGFDHYVQGRIENIEEQTTYRRNLYVTIRDESGGALNMRLLHFSSKQSIHLAKGMWLRLYGNVRLGRRGLEMVHPEYRSFFDDPGPPPPEYVPVYRTTQGLTSQRLRSVIQKALSETAFLPKFNWKNLDLGTAIRQFHEPDPKKGPDSLHTARMRIAFDELLAYSLLTERRRIQQTTLSTVAMPESSELASQLIDRLGFELTSSQIRVAGEVMSDMATPRPMVRLLQGDVGSGKTVIAALAMIRSAENGHQTAFMAPTELLAEQHHETLSEWLSPLGIQVGLLTGRQNAATRRIQQESLAQGEINVVVGTHALIQRSTRFKSLGLAIIDEQHRFGVHQRMQLRNKGRMPHQLIMTATPIPRTLAMFLFSDMDVSIINEMPPGRKPIETTTHGQGKRDAVIDAVQRLLLRGNQAYWVCPAIEERDPDDGDFRGTEDVLKELSQKMPKVQIGHLTGKMKSADKQKTMADFRSGKIQLIVATTVIEVGIDVPNAVLMVIDDADRYGLAQLHQLRGRVGRGSKKSYCMLLYDHPLSLTARDRMDAMRTCSDGFELAQTDLRLRGSGEVFGVKQSGADNFRVADLALDANILVDAREWGRDLSKNQPDLASQVIDTWTPVERDYAAV